MAAGALVAILSWVGKTLATGSGTPQPAPAKTIQKSFPVQIRKPEGPPRVNTGLRDARGEPVLVSCTTCHATRPPDVKNHSTGDLDQFHQKMRFEHGTLTCLACHNRTDYDALNLSDGQRVEFSDVLQLCAQCHGPQYRDYRNGAHGGMTGYWDLAQGPRSRNTCTDCHHPHHPAFEPLWPAPGPRDRFLPSREEHP